MLGGQCHGGRGEGNPKEKMCSHISKIAKATKEAGSRSEHFSKIQAVVRHALLRALFIIEGLNTIVNSNNICSVRGYHTGGFCTQDDMMKVNPFETPSLNRATKTFTMLHMAEKFL